MYIDNGYMVYIRPIPCDGLDWFQCLDAVLLVIYEHDFIGKRVCYLKVDTPSLEVQRVRFNDVSCLVLL